ncbi:MAG: hypothetical protein COB49_03795, partial [Alphaproteobacteria bacterium]
MLKYPKNILLISFSFLSLMLSGCVVEERTTDQSQDFAAFVESVYQRRISDHPMLAAQLGEDKDQDKWDDLSLENMDREVALHRRDLKTLHEEFDYSRLDKETQLNYRAFEADLQLRLERDKWRYHISPINQIVGVHLEIAGILKNSHKIEGLKDVKSYITRLKSVGTPIDQFIRFLKIREDKGFFLSKSVVPRLIDAAQSIIADPREGERQDSNVMLVDFNRKIDKLDLTTEDKTRLKTEMMLALRQYLIPAYQRLIQAFKDH